MRRNYVKSLQTQIQFYVELFSMSVYKKNFNVVQNPIIILSQKKKKKIIFNFVFSMRLIIKNALMSNSYTYLLLCCITHILTLLHKHLHAYLTWSRCTHNSGLVRFFFICECKPNTAHKKKCYLLLEAKILNKIQS